MKCAEVSKELIAYLDRRANSAERRDVEAHLLACQSCRTRAEEFRKLWGVLDELPVEEPSFGFDARLRQRISSEPARWFPWFVPQPRLAFSMALLVALSVWIAHLPAPKTGSNSASAPTEDEQFQMIEHLGVLENYDMLSKSDVLAEVPPAPAAQPDQENQQAPDDGGGSL
jgi:anti-sigma factor RsiW